MFRCGSLLTKSQFKSKITNDKELLKVLQNDWILIGSYEYTLSYAYDDKIHVLYRKPRDMKILYKILYTDHYKNFYL